MSAEVALVAVEAREVSVRLGSTLAVDRVSLSVERGEWVALIGPNGAGKTTLLRALAGLVGVAAGAVDLQPAAPGPVSPGAAPPGLRVEFGRTGLRNSTRSPPGERGPGERGRGERSRRELAKLVALVPQLPATPPALTVAEYVLLGRTPHISYLGSESAADRLAAARAIDRLALTPFIHRGLSSLSGGERQRVVLARALAQAAPILLLDEPTSALDLGRQQEALELLDELRREQDLTVISAMHDLSLAGQYADRLVLLDRGRVVAKGSPHEVLTVDTIAACYRADVRVIEDEDGAVFVLPRRPPC